MEAGPGMTAGVIAGSPESGEGKPSRSPKKLSKVLTKIQPPFIAGAKYSEYLIRLKIPTKL